MREATVSRPDGATASASFPPGSKAPALAQGGSYRRDPIGFQVDSHRRYGDIFSVSFPFYGQFVYVASPQLVKELFTMSPQLSHAGEASATVLEQVLGPSSLFTLDEAPHMRQRKLLLPPFHGERIQRYGELIREVTLHEMESWPVGEPFELNPHTKRIALAVIMRSIFGVHDQEKLARFEHLIETTARKLDQITAFPPLGRNLGRWSPWGRFMAAQRELDEFIYNEIAQRRSENAEGADERDDVLSVLLEARDEDGNPMSDSELRDELLTLLGAGHETTATGLSWAIERLLRTPRALSCLRDSIDSDDDAYIEATVKETLRARPIIGEVVRKLTGPAEIGGYELPKGTLLMAGITAIHYREDLYPDPDEFRPERFLDGKTDTYSWIPFGGGVRRCIGASFAEYEMKVILRTILERADLSAVDQRPEKVKARTITMTPRRGNRVRLNQPLR